MKKIYFILLLSAFSLWPASKTVAQQTSLGSTEKTIKGLNIYPNPINSSSSTILTIQSQLNSYKNVEFYDVLGKRLYATVLKGKRLNVSHLNPGVYILKITENNISEARKLIIK